MTLIVAGLGATSCASSRPVLTSRIAVVWRDFATASRRPSGEKAHEKPDLILCDITMPEMDGYAVLQALREDKETATIPFIFLTARGEKLDVRMGMNYGADDYLTKQCSGFQTATTEKRPNELRQTLELAKSIQVVA